MYPSWKEFYLPLGASSDTEHARTVGGDITESALLIKAIEAKSLPPNCINSDHRYNKT